MKTLVSIAIAISGLLMASCDQAEPIPEPDSGRLTLTQEVLWSNHWAEMRRVRIGGTGVRQISLGENQGARMGVDLSEDEVEVVIMAMLDPGSNTFSWWVTEHSLKGGEHVSGGAGAPDSFKVSEGDYLRDVVSFADPSGESGYGDEIRLLTFNHPAAGRQSVNLTVQ